MKLNAPTRVVFYVSLALAVASLIFQFAVTAVPGYFVALAAYIVLAAACVLKNF